jgi:hypothetical protein
VFIAWQEEESALQLVDGMAQTPAFEPWVLGPGVCGSGG